jgi:hypothetical protein
VIHTPNTNLVFLKKTGSCSPFFLAWGGGGSSHGGATALRPQKDKHEEGAQFAN